MINNCKKNSLIKIYNTSIDNKQVIKGGTVETP